MKKRALMLLVTVLMVALLSTLSVPVSAGPPENAEGLWQYIPSIENARVADGNTFLDTSEVGQWTGTFSGVSTEKGKVVRHSSGHVSFKGAVSFIGKVGDKSGTLEMLAVGSKPDLSSEWEGTWVIISGTGDLATLHGQGTWWGPGYSSANPSKWGDIYYSGEIHFEPE